MTKTKSWNYTKCNSYTWGLQSITYLVEGLNIKYNILKLGGLSQVK